jgi:glyoxylase-like metal-dependent hydrolase (beta-lactamase superfamily II)
MGREHCHVRALWSHGCDMQGNREAAMQQTIPNMPDVKGFYESQTGFYESQTGSIQYVVSDMITGRSAIIDPVLDFDGRSGAMATRSADAILDYVLENGLDVDWILDTHPHADHISAARYLSENTGAPTGIGEHVVRVQELWKRTHNWEGFPTDGSQWDRLFKDGERFRIGQLDAEVIFSPGHTPASITYVIGDAAFVHDTIFMPDSGTARRTFPAGTRPFCGNPSREFSVFPTRHVFSPDTTIGPEVGRIAGRAPWQNRSDRIRILPTRTRPSS